MLKINLDATGTTGRNLVCPMKIQQQKKIGVFTPALGFFQYAYMKKLTLSTNLTNSKALLFYYDTIGQFQAYPAASYKCLLQCNEC